MPEYLKKCTSDGCPLRGKPQSVVCSMRDSDKQRCGCGAMLETHSDQFAGIKVEREWHGQETTSMDMVFAADADLASIKRDCPSMDLKPDKFGLMRPVWKNDKHHRRVRREISAAADRYAQTDRARVGTDPDAPNESPS